MPPRIPLSRPISSKCFRLISHRTFTTTTPLLTKPKVNAIKLLPPTASLPPPFPYGRAQWYKQANTGLYGGQTVQFGNNISERTETKTRRRWHPNIKRKQIFSLALGHKIRLKVSARVMRTMDKVGGLDEYLLGGGAMRVKELGLEGWRLRWAVVNRLALQKRGRIDSRVQQVMEGMKEFAVGRDVADMVQAQAAPGGQAKPRRVKQESVEARIEQRLREQRASFMQEKPATVSMWQRMKRMVGMSS